MAEPSAVVMPAKAGIQKLLDFINLEFLDTGLRRCDESFFNSLLMGT
jgi:hypothetical protein